MSETTGAQVWLDKGAPDCANCRRPVEPDGDDWGHVAAALPASDPAAVEFWANPCPDPRPTEPTSPATCRRCGADAGSGNPQPNSCGKCPPVRCGDCGEPDDRYCSCWVSLEGMPLADIKGLLALGDLSVTTTPWEDR